MRRRGALLGVIIAVLAPALPAAAAEPPSVRLLAADRSLRMGAGELEGSTHLGLWVAATGGDFVISARRPDYRDWVAEQIDAETRATLRTVPPRRLDGGLGLRRFVAVRFLDRRGRLAARRSLGFCPSSGERVDGSGPRAPSYPGYCSVGFPFVRGALWGIDRGWAGAVSGELTSGPVRPVRLAPGRYTVEAEIRAPYRRLFKVPDEHATARLKLRVIRDEVEHGDEPPVPVALAAGRRAPFPARAAQAPTDPAALPDLVALPPWEVSVRSKPGREILRFAGSPWNAGPGPLVVDGYRRRGRDVMDGVQSFIDASGAVVGSLPAGELAFHKAPSHNHWHFLQFVTYRIVKPSGGEVVRARKQSFCLASTDAVDLTLPGAELLPDILGLTGSACGDDRSIWIRQVLPAGWGDTYGAFFAGQKFNITGVPNGRYRLEMRVNPFGQLREGRTDNNVASRRIVLGGRPGERRVRVAPWHGITD